MKFFDAESGGGEGGGDAAPSGDAGMSPGMTAFEPVPKTQTTEKELPVTKPSKVPAQNEPERAEGAPPEETPPASGFDASKFAKEFGATLSETLKPVIERTQPEEKMTPEEARKILNVWEPDDNWYKMYDNLETRADAMNQMRDGLIRQADTLNQLRTREMIDALRQEIMPGLETVSKTANQQREERFKTTYPQLSHDAMQPLIRSIAQDMVDKGKTFTSEAELFKALASGVEAVIKVNNPEFKLTAAENGSRQETTGRGGRQLPVTTPGGGGGTGRRESSSKGEKPRGLAIFDK